MLIKLVRLVIVGYNPNLNAFMTKYVSYFSNTFYFLVNKRYGHKNYSKFLLMYHITFICKYHKRYENSLIKNSNSLFIKLEKMVILKY